jgi:hypothetical protein
MTRRKGDESQVGPRRFSSRRAGPSLLDLAQLESNTRGVIARTARTRRPGGFRVVPGFVRR